MLLDVLLSRESSSAPIFRNERAARVMRRRDSVMQE